MKRQFVPVVVRWKSGGVYRRFSSILALGEWLYAKRGTCGRVQGWSKTDLELFRRLSLSRTMFRRAQVAYTSWLCGTSRIRPRG